jgi:multidrug efflux pump subunit AcrB
VTAAALIPLVVGGAGAGREVLRPLAVVMTSSLVSTALACRFVLPALWRRFAPPPEAVIRLDGEQHQQIERSLILGGVGDD